VDQSAERKTLGDAEQALAECTQLEADLAELKAAYEQFFLGLERRPPTAKHDGIKKRMVALKGQFLRQTSAKFRVQSIAAKLLTYERLWERTIMEIEAGTYRRDVFKARLHQKQKHDPARATEHPDEDLDLSDLDDDDDLDSALEQATQAVSKPPAPMALPTIAPLAPPAAPASVLQGLPSLTPAIKPVTGSRPVVTPAQPLPVAAKPPAAKPPAPLPPPPAAAGQGGLSDQKIKAIYEAYVMAKKRCGEDTRALTLDSVASTLKKQVPELMKQHNARSVEFKVVIKDGKAVLRALPKDS
jgi:hypothetical protein